MKQLQRLCPVLAVFAIVVSFAGCKSGLDKSIWASRSVPDPVAGSIGVADGVFSGNARGFKGDIYVEVTVANDSITNITVRRHKDTANLAKSVFKHFSDVIIRTQSTDVDVVTGATITSRAFVTAIENALTNAGADLDSLRAGPRIPLAFVPGTYTGVGNGRNGPVTVSVTFGEDSIRDIAVVQHGDTEDFFARALGGVVPAILERQSTKVDTVSGATLSSNGLISAVKAAMEEASIKGGGATTGEAVDVNELGPFTPGTFEGVGAGGIHGKVEVSVTFDETKITSIVITQTKETPSVAGPAFEALTSQVLQKQTYEVDAFSGATFASKAFLSAVQDAVRQAKQ